MSEIAWAAGFYDGEGCTTARPSGKSRKDGSQYLTLRMYVKQTREGPLNRFRNAVGCGRVHGPFPPNSVLGKKDFWFWEAASKTDTARCVGLLRPLLCKPKRQQIDKALEERERCNAIHTTK